MQNNEERKLVASQTITKVFGIIMVVLYIVFGTTIIVKAPQIQDIQVSYARTFGVVLILYGLYRAYNLYRKYFSESES